MIRGRGAAPTPKLGSDTFVQERIYPTLLTVRDARLDRIGLVLGGLPVRDAVEIAQRAEERGLESVWVYETIGRDAPTSLGAIAFSTRRILLGTGLLSLFVRTPTLLPMTYASLDELSNGRMILGIGVSYERALRSRHAVPFPERPFTMLREYVDVFRGALAADPFRYEGQIVSLKGFSLGFKPRRARIPVYLGAHNPKMLELAGEIADGVVLNLVTEEEIGFFLEHLAIGAKRAGRSLSDIDIASFFNVCPSGDRALTRTELRRRLHWFMVMPHIIARLKRTRFRPEAEKIEGLVKEGREREVPEVITDPMIDAMCISEPPDRILARVDAYRSRGIRLPILFPTPIGGDVKKGLSATLDLF